MATLHFHMRRRENALGFVIPASPKSTQIWMIRDEADKAFYEQLAKYPDQDGLLELVPCKDDCKGVKHD